MSDGCSCLLLVAELSNYSRSALASHVGYLLDSEGRAQVGVYGLLLLLDHLLSLVGKLSAHAYCDSGEWLHDVDVLDALRLATATLVGLTCYAHVASYFVDGVPASLMSVVLRPLLSHRLAHYVGLEDILDAVAVYYILHLLVEGPRTLVLDTLNSSLILILSGGLEIVSANSVDVLNED